MADADLPEFDDQDQSEMFDEDILGDEGVGPSNDMRVFEELPDVYDATSAVGDADVDGDLDAADADELEDEALDDIDLDEDDDDLEDLGDEPEDDEIFDEDEDDLDDVDAVDVPGDDEVEQTVGGDLNEEGSDDEVADYESEDELSDEDVKELGYQDEEEEEVGEDEDDAAPESHGNGLVPSGPGKPAQGRSGEAADLAAERLQKHDMDELDTEERQDRLLDEGVEETFPASDPVSVKRIT